MGKINVYLPQDLEAEVKKSNLNISAICQDALREALQHPQPSNECGHTVIVRGRCELCGDRVEIAVIPRKRRKAS